MAYGKLNEDKSILYFRNPLVNGERTIYNPSAEQLNAADYWEVVDVAEDGENEVKDGKLYHYTGAETLAQAIESKCTEIDAYNNAEGGINEAYITYGDYVDFPFWLGVSDRIKLGNAITREQNLGNTEFCEWYEGKYPFTFSCNVWQGLLNLVENYAHKCSNKINEHKYAVRQLTDISEVKAYDFYQGYPDKLHLNPNEL